MSLPVVPQFVQVCMMKPKKWIIWWHHPTEIALLSTNRKMNQAMWRSFDQIAKLHKFVVFLHKFLHYLGIMVSWKLMSWVVAYKTMFVGMRHFKCAVSINTLLNESKIFWFENGRLEWLFGIIWPVLPIKTNKKYPIRNRNIWIYKSQLVLKQLDKVSVPRKKLRGVVGIWYAIQMNSCPVVNHALHFVSFWISCQQYFFEGGPLFSCHVTELFSYSDPIWTLDGSS